MQARERTVTRTGLVTMLARSADTGSDLPQEGRQLKAGPLIMGSTLGEETPYRRTAPQFVFIKRWKARVDKFIR